MGFDELTPRPRWDKHLPGFEKGLSSSAMVDRLFGEHPAYAGHLQSQLEGERARKAEWAAQDSEELAFLEDKLGQLRRMLL